MVRVPTYSSYMNLVNTTLSTKSSMNEYIFQAMTGVKSSTYSGYGTKAYNIVNLESSLTLNENFVANNSQSQTELEMISTSLESVESFTQKVKSLLASFSNSGLSTITPDYTGGELTFTDNSATYLGETITIDDTQYTFANNSTGNNIDISGLTSGSATYAEDVMTALYNKVSPTNSEIKLEDGKLSFPLYTVNGTSSVLNVNGVETGETHTMTSEQQTSLAQVQEMAFAAMKSIADNLNANVNGNYLLGGGVSDQAPVTFPFNSLQEFQAYYDGVNVSYPTSSTALLSNKTVTSESTGNLTLALDSAGSNKATITAANTGGFTTEVVSANTNTTGNLTFNSSKNSVKATETGAFSAVKAGDTLVISGGNSGGNDKAYVVKSVSDDGKTITFEDSTPVVADATITPSDDVKFATSFPVGSVINLENFGNGIASNAQVTGISDDGSQLFITVDADNFPSTPTTIPATQEWSIETESYYNGGSLSNTKRISENQTITLDITAQDEAFSKIFAALGSIAQGNFVDTRNPADDLTSVIDSASAEDKVTDALNMLNEALGTKVTTTNSKNGDIQTIFAKLSTMSVTLDNTIETQEQLQTNLSDAIYNLKNVDQEEASIMALTAYNNLQISYSVLQQALSTSLLDFIK
ncbi:MAG: hypothetical protein PHE89_04550 [Alphaproteobacteria bacterium]|nr:hypothetical protein [Alphaproteobacteria bacterium]